MEVHLQIFSLLLAYIDSTDNYKSMLCIAKLYVGGVLTSF